MKVILSSQDKFRFAMLRFRLFEKSRRTEREREKKEARLLYSRGSTHTHTVGPHREKSRRTADFGVTRCAPLPIKALLMQANPGAARNELPL